MQPTTATVGRNCTSEQTARTSASAHAARIAYAMVRINTNESNVAKRYGSHEDGTKRRARTHAYTHACTHERIRACMPARRSQTASSACCLAQRAFFLLDLASPFLGFPHRPAGAPPAGAAALGALPARAPRKTSHKLSSTMANTTCLNAPRKSPSNAAENSEATSAGSFLKTPQPHAPRTTASNSSAANTASSLCIRCRLAARMASSLPAEALVDATPKFGAGAVSTPTVKGASNGRPSSPLKTGTEGLMIMLSV
mmetsp:Transcript_116046/g.361551  ORF Transcript_116046/g.361551 Transcript_116046/m.361551 type:complete len:256 (-) Transcript_116046:551-1318(-)